MIRQSVVDWCAFMNDREPDAADFFRYARSLGMTGAEMVAPERRAAAKAAGLQLLNRSGPGMSKGLNRRENHAALLPEIVAALEDAAAAGIPWVIVFSGNREGQPDREGIGNCACGLQALLPECERLGVGLLFEMLNSFDHADYQADHGRYGFELIERLGSPRCKLLYDVYHLERMGDNVLADLRTNLPLIGHFHCAACPDRSTAANSRTIDYRSVAELAEAGGYGGFFGQEFLPGADLRGELAAACAALQPEGGR